MIGKKWLWWNLWLGLKPNLKSGRFEEFKQELADKTAYALEHLEEVVREREEAEKKHLPTEQQRQVAGQAED